MRQLCILMVLMAMCGTVWSDAYLHNPRGSNNRLDGENRERQNANRMFDSQNNNRGGYNVGGDGNSEADPMKYMVGSKVRVEWTNQHECGLENTECMIILQYMCAPHLRDGRSTQTINVNRDLRDTAESDKGQHETQRSYGDCQTRQRNGGLYVGDQDLAGKTAKFTRQNPNGGRSGLECPEERDYYPYWGPSEWKDIAILTNDLARCKTMAKESQNVAPRSYCRLTYDALRRINNNNLNARDDYIAPLNQAECEGKGSKFEWVTAPAFGIAEPECLKPPVTRDNHNGNSYVPGQQGSDKIPQSSFYEWTVPNDVGPRCALRLRYNISIGDYLPYETTRVDSTPSNDKRGTISRIPIGEAYGLTAQESADRGYYMENNPKIKPLKAEGIVQDDLELELAINTAQTGRIFEDRSHRFQIDTRPANIPANAVIHNVNIRGKRGNIVQVYPAVEYDFVPNDLVVNQNDYVHIQWTGSLRNPGNNDGEGQNKEDKNNIIPLKGKSYGGANPADVYGYPGNNYPLNLNDGTILGLGRDFANKAAMPPKERRKRDEMSATNDTFAVADEVNSLDDVLSELKVEMEELRDTLTNINENEKDVAGLENDDKAEIDTKDDYEIFEDTEMEDASPSSRRRRRRRRRRSSSSRRRQQQQQQQQRNTQLDDVHYYVDLEPQKAATCGKWFVMCTRNNNFSNRSQKGTMTVQCPTK